MIINCTYDYDYDCVVVVVCVVWCVWCDVVWCDMVGFRHVVLCPVLSLLSVKLQDTFRRYEVP